MLRVALLCVFLVGATAQTTEISACTQHAGDVPINVFIEGCPTPPCYLPQLQDVVVHIVFKAPRNLRTMRTVATAYLFGILGIDYDLGEFSNTCNFLNNSYCPVLEGEVVQYTLRMFIESFFFAGTSASVEFRVEGDNPLEDPILCLRVPIVITPPVVSARK